MTNSEKTDARMKKNLAELDRQIEDLRAAQKALEERVAATRMKARQEFDARLEEAGVETGAKVLLVRDNPHPRMLWGMPMKDRLVLYPAVPGRAPIVGDAFLREARLRFREVVIRGTTE